MLSSDKNVETIADLIKTLRHYVSVLAEYTKLDAIDKVVQLLTAVALLVISSVIILFVIFFLSIMAAYWIAPMVGKVAAFAIMAGIYLLLFVVFLCNKRRWIERPLVKFLANLLLSK